MVAKDRQKTTGSPKVEVGEIDTRAPFQSVKDAVSLFGEGAFSGSGEKPAIKKPREHSAERVLVKESQLHLAQKELNKLKEQLKNAETTKAQALVELEKAKRTVEDLAQKLNTVTESKESATKASEAAKSRVLQLEEANGGSPAVTNGAQKEDLETGRAQYVTVITELDAAKQLLRQIRQDRDATLEAKVAASKQAEEAEHAAKANLQKAGELSKEITDVQESIGLVKLAMMQAQQEQAKIFAEKDVQKQSYKATLEESAKKLLALKKEFDPELTKNLEAQLAETVTEIEALQKQMENAKASDLDCVRTVTSELDDAKGSLHKAAEEEVSLRSMVESLKQELEKVKKEHSELKEKEAGTESIAGNLHVKLRKSKSELEAALAEEAKVSGASEEMISTLHQLSSETENARREAEEMMKKAEELKKEAEATRVALEEAEQQLKVALEEAEEAKAAEARALNEIKMLSEETNAARASTSESGAQITISREEFEALSRKVEESDKLAEMKVAAAVAQVEAVKASENEALKRLEVTQKEIDGKMLRENSSQNELRKESLYSACDGCLQLLRQHFLKAADADLQEVGQIARQADNLHWILDILIDRQIAEEFLKTWASQSELSDAHSKVPAIHRYEVSRVTARLFVGIGKGQLLASKDARCLLLRTWLGPFYDDFGWMRRASNGLDRHLIEDGLSNTILTLPLSWQQEILMSWFDRFLNSGDDCPNIQRGFEIWWRRAFWRRNGGSERPQQMRITTASIEN